MLWVFFGLRGQRLKENRGYLSTLPMWWVRLRRTERRSEMKLNFHSNWRKFPFSIVCLEYFMFFIKHLNKSCRHLYFIFVYSRSLILFQFEPLLCLIFKVSTWLSYVVSRLMKWRASPWITANLKGGKTDVEVSKSSQKAGKCTNI